MMVLAIFTSLFWIVLTIDWCFGICKVHMLSHAEPKLRAYPSLSIVIPALNKGRALETSLRSVLNQDYPNFELLVLNDRLTEQREEVLERMRKHHPAQKVKNIKALPKGWLGRNNVLHTGAQQAHGEWLLFTDADVQFEPNAVSAALVYAVRHKVDHLTAVSHTLAKSPWLKPFVSVFILLFSFGGLRASAPATKAYVGLGTFNLLRRSVYEKTRGHKSIAMCPDDDMKLGKLIKCAGYKQVTVFAPDLIRVKWYTSVGEVIGGLNKNAFAGLGYSLMIASAAILVLIVANAIPFIAV